MEKSKKTLKMIGICIIGLVIVVAVNMLKKPEDPFKNADGAKLGGYQHVEESDILNSKDYDSYYVYFYETGNEKCKDTNEAVKSYVRGKSSIYVFNMEEAKDIKTGKNFDYKNVIDYKDILYNIFSLFNEAIEKENIMFTFYNLKNNEYYHAHAIYSQHNHESNINVELNI